MATTKKQEIRLDHFVQLEKEHNENFNELIEKLFKEECKRRGIKLPRMGESNNRR